MQKETSHKITLTGFEMTEMLDIVWSIHSLVHPLIHNTYTKRTKANGLISSDGEREGASASQSTDRLRGKTLNTSCCSCISDGEDSREKMQVDSEFEIDFANSK